MKEEDIVAWGALEGVAGTVAVTAMLKYEKV